MGGVKAGLMTGVLAVAWIGHAAAQAPGTAEPRAQIQARAKLVAMEKMLETAVQLGAQRLRAQVQAAFPRSGRASCGQSRCWNRMRGGSAAKSRR